ncbi:flavin-dependent dehydrogenase [Methylocaldum marinum]|uniref:Flavin-dependent dehydrogenase n=1 Tax=Methylocaldum marinum TaxID=1432792 RepID=A0A250KTG0_9GAMM|nr:hypothetical protein [Methylocaldum marinum]BBA34935.1 flavin-dependent dehydrogenase [Methylocaldum marinum]
MSGRIRKRFGHNGRSSSIGVVAEQRFYAPGEDYGAKLQDLIAEAPGLRRILNDAVFDDKINTLVAILRT